MKNLLIVAYLVVNSMVSEVYIQTRRRQPLQDAPLHDQPPHPWRWWALPIRRLHRATSVQRWQWSSLGREHQLSRRWWSLQFWLPVNTTRADSTDREMRGKGTRSQNIDRVSEQHKLVGRCHQSPLPLVPIRSIISLPFFLRGWLYILTTS